MKMHQYLTDCAVMKIIEITSNNLMEEILSFDEQVYKKKDPLKAIFSSQAS